MLSKHLAKVEERARRVRARIRDDNTRDSDLRRLVGRDVPDLIAALRVANSAPKRHTPQGDVAILEAGPWGQAIREWKGRDDG